jgi:sulfur-oxidizing protein SoxY
MQRRTFLKGTITAGVATSVGLIAPSALAKWSKETFEADSPDAVLKALLGETKAEASDKIKIKAPEIAENGAVVPIEITTDIEGAESIAIIIEKNPTPLAANFVLGEGAVAGVKCRCKMGKTSNVTAVIKAGDKAYTSTTEVKVTKGGCGG